jgi:NAD(P)-dependent dehydrogenase (short-subunit alcohol dehydrogenase family)
MELRPLGIHVVIIQPGSIKTPAVEKTLGGVEQAIERWPEAGRVRYAALFRRFSARASAREVNGTDPDIVARTILFALTTPRPRARYPTGKDAQMLTLLPRFVPDRAPDFLRLKIDKRRKRA